MIDTSTDLREGGQLPGTCLPCVEKEKDPEICRKHGRGRSVAGDSISTRYHIYTMTSQSGRASGIKQLPAVNTKEDLTTSQTY